MQFFKKIVLSYPVPPLLITRAISFPYSLVAFCVYKIRKKSNHSSLSGHELGKAVQASVIRFERGRVAVGQVWFYCWW